MFAAEATCPGCGRSAWISGENGVRDPRTASTDCDAARSAILASRSALVSTSAPIAVMNWVPLISASPSLAPSTRGSSPARRRASAPGSSSPPISASPSPTSGSARCASGARSPLAPSEPREGTRGCTPSASSASSSSTVSRRTPERTGRQRIGPQQDRRAHDLGRERLADTAGMAAQQVELQPRDLIMRDRHVDEPAEAGVHTVGRRARLDGLLDQRARRRDPPDRPITEPHRRAAKRHALDVLDGQAVPGQLDLDRHAPVSLRAACRNLRGGG